MIVAEPTYSGVRELCNFGAFALVLAGVDATNQFFFVRMHAYACVRLCVLCALLTRALRGDTTVVPLPIGITKVTFLL